MLQKKEGRIFTLVYCGVLHKKLVFRTQKLENLVSQCTKHNSRVPSKSHPFPFISAKQKTFFKIEFAQILLNFFTIFVNFTRFVNLCPRVLLRKLGYFEFEKKSAFGLKKNTN